MPKVPRQPARPDAPPLIPMVTIDLAAGQPVAQGLGRRSTSRPGKGPSKAQQSRRLEAAAQRLPEPELAAARAAFAQLDLAAQWQLASELAVSREPEFAHWVRSVVGLAVGFKRRRNHAGHEHLHPEPCVIFIVRRKWAKPGVAADEAAAHSPQSASQTLPSELLGFAAVAGERRLCAVPCDVQAQDRLLAVRAHAASAIAVGPEVGELLGTVSFAVKAPDGQLYAVAPIHVLSPSLPLDGRGVVGGNLAWRVISKKALADPALLSSTLKGGALRPFNEADPVESLDVQLAEVTDRAMLRDALQGWKLSAKQPMVTGEPALAALMVTRRAYLMVPSNHPHAPAPRRPIEVTLSMGERLHFPTYHFGGGEPVAARHRVLELCLLDGHRSLPGDSGSAVVLDLGQGEFSLIGMHIAAGEPSGNSFVIPAWRMFNPMAYLKVDGQWFDGPVTLARSW